MQPVAVKSYVARITMVGLAVVLGMAAVGVEAGELLGAESPQAVVERLRAAAESNDLAEVAACLAPEDRENVTVGMILMSSMTVAMGGGMAAEMAGGLTEAFAEDMSDEEKAEAEAKMKEAKAEAKRMEEKLKKIFEAHGAAQWLDEEDVSEPSLEGIDQIGLIRDLQGFMRDLDPESDQQQKPVPNGELEDLVIEGDRATGTIGGEDAEFVKVDGRWFVKMAGGDDQG